ncbi:cleft lip and palate transmembrane protein 1-like protein [Lytechinus variegatus]|uniref:cleft lip and palate transmembrane protein 1-like protein n=1 Tax=Lytechinus variegatus TaxID=7654 RepID=UPI001BB2A343|nr:cleft lip and palate transmembrane protein 1-like protein [Lytechinus variegatus]
MPSIGSFVNNVVILLVLGYLCNMVYTMYYLFNPPQCNIIKDANKCLARHQGNQGNMPLQLRLYSSQSKLKHPQESQLTEILHVKEFNISEDQTWTVNISLPARTRKNGTLYIHVYLQVSSTARLDASMAAYQTSSLTKYSPPKMEAFNLLGDSKPQNDSLEQSVVPIAHWKPRIELRVLEEPFVFHRMQIPADIYRYIRLTPKGDYLPILYLHKMAEKLKDLQPINSTCKEMPLTIEYSPISIGQLRLFGSLEEGMSTMYQLGFTEKDTEEVKSIFTDTNLVLLMATIFVSFFHILFDFLAFKNDISYWRARNSMVGLSIRTVTWRCVSQIIVFLYLQNENTSLLVLIPCGIGAVIEVWKVKKAFKVSISFEGWRPSFTFGTATDSEKATAEFDTTAMKYLSYLLYPLCVIGAIYSLVYVPHKSWYSWLINGLVNGVYAFGFLFMLPQLFVNYKLKSVAHLPWRAFMYKAFNTFIDDVFAFIITMPTAHRVACFRDDVVFVIYLYQRWLYPVDKTRANEYGVSYEDEKKGKEHTD